MEELIVYIVTIILTWFLGVLSKKSEFISNNLIPLQNLAIGIIIALIEWYITKDFSTAIALSGLMAGGTYDIIHNLSKMTKEKEDELEYGDEGEIEDEL